MNYLRCIPEVLHTGPAREWTAELITLVAPGKMAVTGTWSGEVSEVYRLARRAARTSVRQANCFAMISVSRNGRYFATDSIRRAS